MMFTFDICVLVLAEVFQCWDYSVHDVVDLDVFCQLFEFEAGDAPDLWLDVVDVFYYVGQEGFEAFLAHRLC